MNAPFGRAYAESYDALYSDKDYEAECDLVERLFAHSERDVRRVLDLGCGTGNHAVPLAKRGYQVVGVDRSEAMLSAARGKTESGPEFHCADVRTVDLARAFDAVLMMFAVLGYQTSDADVLAALGTARRHLEPDGLLIFDVWYGPAVLRLGPSERVKQVPIPGGQVSRSATAELDLANNLCTVRYRLREVPHSGTARESEDIHAMRYFFAPELAQFLDRTGFQDLRLGAFPDFEHPPDDTTWNVLGIATAAG